MNNMNTKRVEELIEKMDSYKKETYHRCERLDEMFKLQNDLVKLTFNGDHAENASLKIWDVENHLDQMNAECGNIADEELNKFKEECRTFINLIKAEISGQRGEAKAFRNLEYIRSKHIVLKNVELDDGNLRTELDALVITPSCLTIVEVKNTSKNIFIDENGDYYRTGEFLKWDCNIAEKMSVKEALLKKVLKDAGMEDVKVNGIVAFTDNRIEVQNKYSQITTCFVSQLAHLIDGSSKESNISEEKMLELQTVVEKAARKESYPADFDVNQFKRDFATVLTILEEAKEQAYKIEEQAEIETENVSDEKETFGSVFRRIIKSKAFKYAIGTAATIGLSVGTGFITNNTIGKGGFFKW